MKIKLNFLIQCYFNSKFTGSKQLSNIAFFNKRQNCKISELLIKLGNVKKKTKYQEIAGNCRICLVKIKKMLKLVLACAIKIAKNMIIKTKNKRVIRSRRSIVEFLLINHPLDCPICDKGGECDLQNIARDYGYDRGRFYEFEKRSVIDKESGYFIKTIMTLCIHCTRCVHFFKEIVGVLVFSLVSRGEATEIVANKFNLLLVLSGNVIDLCLLGALTFKIYKFKGRFWELNKNEKKIK